MATRVPSKRDGDGERERPSLPAPAIGYYVVAGEVVPVIPREGETGEDAAQRIARHHGVRPGTFNRR